MELLRHYSEKKSKLTFYSVDKKIEIGQEMGGEKFLTDATFLGLVFRKYTSREGENSRTKNWGKFISRWVYFCIKVNMNNIRCPHTIR